MKTLLFWLRLFIRTVVRSVAWQVGKLFSRRFLLLVAFLHCVNFATAANYSPRAVFPHSFDGGGIPSVRYYRGTNWTSWYAASMGNSSLSCTTPNTQFGYWESYLGSQTTEPVAAEYRIGTNQAVSMPLFCTVGSNPIYYWFMPSADAPPQNTNCVVVGNVKNPGGVSQMVTWSLTKNGRVADAGVKELAPYQWWTPSWSDTGTNCPLIFTFQFQEGPSGSTSSTNWTATNAIAVTVSNMTPYTAADIIENAANIPTNSPAGLLGGSTSNAMSQADGRLNTAATIGALAENSDRISSSLSNVSASTSSAISNQTASVTNAIANGPTYGQDLSTNGLLAASNRLSALIGNVAGNATNQFGNAWSPVTEGVGKAVNAIYDIASSEEAPADWWVLDYNVAARPELRSMVKLPPDSTFNVSKFFSVIGVLFPDGRSWFRGFLFFFLLIGFLILMYRFVMRAVDSFLATPAGGSGTNTTGIVGQVGGNAAGALILAGVITALIIALPALFTLIAGKFLFGIGMDLGQAYEVLANSPVKSAHSLAVNFRRVFYEMNISFPLFESFVFAANYLLVDNISFLGTATARLFFKIASVFA